MSKLARAITATTVLALALNVAPANAKTESSGCVYVSQSTQDALSITGAGTVKAKGEMGGNRATAWYVASPTGAVWAVNTAPKSTDFGGLILPINQLARDFSDIGADIAPTAPIYGTLSATAKEVKKAQKCATTHSVVAR